MTTIANSIPFWDPAVVYANASGQRGGVFSMLPEDEHTPWPTEFSEWNTITMAGMRAPGLATVKGARGKRFTSEQNPGESGALLNFYGYDYAQFSIKLQLWTPKQFSWLQRFLPLISPPPSATVTPKAVSCVHPALAVMQIQTVYVTKVDLPEIQNGMLIQNIECVEFLTSQGAAGAGLITSATTFTQQADGTVITATSGPANPKVPGTGSTPANK